MQLQPRIPSVSLYNPTVAIHSTEEESRYFQLFAERTAHELSGYQDDNFWTRIVLQESHHVASIRHAVIALGALNKSLETAPSPHLKVNVIQSINKTHHEQAVLQHLKAIQSLNQYISDSSAPQLRNALISCLLFVCFEIFQGSYASSVQHTYGGLKILRSYYQGKPSSRSWMPQRSLLPHPQVGEISRALQTRPGCDNISKERVIASHLEEYLETENTPQVESDAISKPTVQVSEAGESDSVHYDPQVQQIQIPRTHMTGTDYKKEQQRILSMVTSNDHSTRQVNDYTSLNVGNSPPNAYASGAIRNHSSGISSSNVSTPATYTPPSTNPQTPNSALSNQAVTSNRKRPLSSRTPSPPLLQNDLAIEESLIQTFVRLDGQGLFFGMVPGIPPLIWDVHKLWYLPIPESFPDLASAQRCWDFLMDRALQFYRRTLFNRAYSPQNCESPQTLARNFSSYMDQLTAFEKAYQPILEQAMKLDGTISNPAALILSLYHKCTVITLSQIPAPSEMVYDNFLQDFKYITRICAQLTASQNATQLPQNPRFSFEIGIVPPLHITATKCRDPVVRREAVKLLFANPRQEGMWDGVLSARIGRWLTACEEDELDPPPLLDSDNISGMRNPMGEGMGSKKGKQLVYPSPPAIVDEMGRGGCWEGGTKISETVKVALGWGSQVEGEDIFDASEAATSAGRAIAERSRAGVKRKRSGDHNEEQGQKRNRGWMVPEKNRVTLMVVHFHIPDRYIRVKCQKVVPGPDGKKEEREAVIAW